MSCNIIKLGKSVLQSPLMGLINLSIQTSTFPDSLKREQVTSLHKKNNPINISNFRPVSILTPISKLYEMIFPNILYQYFEDILDENVCAFRRKHGCQTTYQDSLRTGNRVWLKMNM